MDLAAPGVSIANVFPGDNYVFWSGTSFSSPIVAGVAGLVWSANTALTNAEVDQILRDSADNIGSSFFFGDGRVNAESAVLLAGSPPPSTIGDHNDPCTLTSECDASQGLCCIVGGSSANECHFTNITHGGTCEGAAPPPPPPAPTPAPTPAPPPRGGR